MFPISPPTKWDSINSIKAILGAAPEGLQCEIITSNLLLWREKEHTGSGGKEVSPLPTKRTQRDSTLPSELPSHWPNYLQVGRGSLCRWKGAGKTEWRTAPPRPPDLPGKMGVGSWLFPRQKVCISLAAPNLTWIWMPELASGIVSRVNGMLPE